MTKIDLSSYTTLNKYEVLAGSGTIEVRTGASLNVVNTSSQFGVANWGTETGTNTGTITGSSTGSGTAGLQDNTNAATAQTELTNLITAIKNAGTGTEIALDSDGKISAGQSGAGTYNYLANTRYRSSGDITYPGGAVLTFTGGATDQIYIISPANLTFGKITTNLVGGIVGTNIFCLTFQYLDLNGGGLSPLDIKGNLIVESPGGGIGIFQTTTIDGRIYSKRYVIVTEDVVNVTANYSLQNNSPICFNKGTKILCVDDNGKEVYRLIEDLNIGDLVKTRGHGNLPIEYIQHGSMINNPNIWNECMYRLPSTNPEFEDLVVTGAHGILKEYLSDEEIDADYKWFANHIHMSRIDGLFLQRAAFCKEFIQEVNNDEYIYYHLSLKGEEGRRYGIWGNGVLTESTFKREMVRAFGVSDA